MKKQKNSKKKAVIFIITAVVLCAALTIAGLSVYGKQMKKLQGMTFTDCVEYTNRGNPDAVITVGVIKDGKASYKVYARTERNFMPSSTPTR